MADKEAKSCKRKADDGQAAVVAKKSTAPAVTDSDQPLPTLQLQVLNDNGTLTPIHVPTSLAAAACMLGSAVKQQQNSQQAVALAAAAVARAAAVKEQQQQAVIMAALRNHNKPPASATPTDGQSTRSSTDQDWSKVGLLFLEFVILLVPWGRHYKCNDFCLTWS